MTEREYVLEHFGERLGHLKGRRALLCGDGAYTRAILERYAGAFGFAGAVPPQEGEAAIARLAPGAVILSEHKAQGEPDYRAMEGPCRAAGIPLYDMYGVEELSAHDGAAACAWLEEPGWMRLTEGYDVVCFAAMDTFLISGESLLRSGLRPRAVLRRVALSLLARGVTVLFVSRNAAPREAVEQALRQAGVLQSPENLYMRAGEDLCFRTIRERFPGARILHIGSSVGNDCLVPRFYGIDTYRMVFYGAEEPAPAPLPPQQACLPLCDREALLEKMRAADAVSFDVFDTLVLRRALKPSDVFERCEGRPGVPGGFAALRREAERRRPGGNLYDIYEELRAMTGADEKTRDGWLALELEEEAKVLVPRRSVVALMKQLIREGRRVLLISDMYLPGALLSRLLEGAGITGYERLLVSCDEGVKKGEGLFARAKALLPPGATLLHVGDNPASDVQGARAEGVQAAHIPSTAFLARAAGWGEALDKAACGSLSERGLVGVCLSLVFEDPFRVPCALSLEGEARWERFGQAAAGPMMAGYMTFLARRAKEKRADGVLFAARDGYLLREMYERMAQAEASLPAGMYLYTGRHPAFLANGDGEAGLRALRRESALDGCEAALSRLFDIPSPKKPEAGEDTPEGWYRANLEAIRETARSARAGFAAHFRKLGLKAGGNYLITDFVAEGTCQALMERFAPFTLSGCYFGRPGYAEEADRVEYYVPGENRAFLTGYLEMETVMTSPEPAVNRLDGAGNPVFDREARSPGRMAAIAAAHRGMRAVGEAFLSLWYDGSEVRGGLMESLYAAEAHGVDAVDYDDWLHREL